MLTKATFNFYSWKLVKPGKVNCGDDSRSTIVNINNHSYILLLQADGVSSAPRDFEASANSVDNIYKYLIKHPKTNDISILLKEAILSAHIKLNVGLTTICLMLISESTNKVWYCNIGDSRIYGYKDSQWTQLSIDHTRYEIYKENGRNFNYQGKPVFRSLLTQCLGMNGRPEIVINEINNDQYTGFCLVSDGFYELDDSEERMSMFYNAIDINGFINSQLEYFQSSLKDDCSISIWRKPIKVEENINIEVYRQLNYSKSSIYNVIALELNNLLNKKINYDRIDEIIKKMVTFNIYFNKSELISILDKILKNQININPSTLINFKKKLNQI